MRFLITGPNADSIQQADLEHQVCYDLTGMKYRDEYALELSLECGYDDRSWHYIDITETQLAFMNDMMAAMKAATETGYVE